MRPGAAKAPLAGLIMVCEITGNYGLLPPLLIATTLHLALSRKWTLYASQRHNKFSSPVHEHALKVDVLNSVSVKDVFTEHADIPILRMGWKLREAFGHIRASEHEFFPVLGEDGSIVGLVSSASLHLAAAESHAENLVLVGDLMTDEFCLEPAMDLHQALSVFLKSGAAQLPVLNPMGKVFGMLQLHDIMSQYDRLTRTAEENGPDD